MEAIFFLINKKVHAVVWGPLMLLLMLGVGLYFTVGTGFFQIKKCKQIFLAIFPEPKSIATKNPQSISSFQATATSLAGCLGTGNIVGVATTLVIGGPGALFWMWVSAFLGMMTKFAEIVLAVHFRTYNKKGEAVGGPMYYIEKGLGVRFLGVLFAVLGVAASFGIGNMTQINSIAHSFSHFSVNPFSVGAVVALFVAFVIIGGIKRIAAVSGVLIPVFALIYTVGAIVVLCVYAKEIPLAFESIFADVFRLPSVGGGVLGYAMSRALRFGVARGVFSNEAGLGSGSFAHAATNSQHPVKEGMWGIFEVFVDTIVMCTLTGLVILTTGVLTTTGDDGATLTANAFSSVFSPALTNVFLAVSISFFAFASLIGWSYYGEKCVEYLFDSPRAVMIYKFVFILCVVVGALLELRFVWSLSDTLNGAMAIPNLIALIGLRKTVLKLTKEYRQSPKTMKSPR